MWLTEHLSPDCKTIADFRKDNHLGIKNACKTFVQMCHKFNMFSEATVAIEGSKFKASNNKDKNYTPSKIKSHIERVENILITIFSSLNNQIHNRTHQITWLILNLR